MIRRRTALFSSFLTLTALVALTVPHFGPRTARAGDWKSILANAGQCGISRRCELDVEGTAVKSGRQVRGLARVISASDHGILAELGATRVWLDQNGAPHEGATVITPGTCTLSWGHGLKVRDIKLDVQCQTLGRVTGKIWSSIQNAPDPYTYSSAFDWIPTDVRLTGRLEPAQVAGTKKLPANVGLTWNGRYLVLDHVAVRDLVNLPFDCTLKQADLQLTLPQVIPDPQLTSSFFDRSPFVD